MADNIILMADIIRSREKPGSTLMKQFKLITSQITKKNESKFKSPITITLGDEFQSVMESLADGVSIILQLEEEIVRKQADFRLRYVLWEGEIETRVNRKVGYEMLGAGLTNAREFLNSRKEEKQRFHIKLKNPLRSTVLFNSFLIAQDYIDGWNRTRDFLIVTEFLKNDDYKEVADKLGRNRSLIWKRKQTLKISEYKAIKQVINFVAQTKS